MATSQAYEDWIAEARGTDMVAVARECGATLRKSGGEWIGPCPVCGGNDRFAVNPGEGVYNCRGCESGGDVIEMVKRLDGVDFAIAVEKLAGRPAPKTGNGATNGEHAPRNADKGRHTATFDYVDETGRLVCQTLRYDFDAPPGVKPKKTFRQRRPDGKGGWIWNLKDVELVPYRLPELQEAIAQDVIVFVVEGEKKADRLVTAGAPATCNPMGAKKWPAAFDDIFRGARVVILPDNDDNGRAHAALVAGRLAGIAQDVRVVELPGLLEPKEDVVEWFDKYAGTVERLYDIAARTPLWNPDAPSAYQPKFGPMAWADVWGVQQSYPWLVKHLIPEREAVLMYGAPQTGKSFLAQDLAMSVARGIPFFGHKVRRAGVIYCAFEGGRGFRQRQKAYGLHHEIGSDVDVPLIVLTKRADLFGDVDFEPLCTEIEVLSKTLSSPLGLVVLDTWSASTPGADENASKDVSKVRSRVVALLERFGCSVIVVHHKPAGGGKPRGHTSLTGDFETTVDVDWAEGQIDANGRKVRAAVLTKQREATIDVKLRFVLRSVEVSRDEDGEAVTSCVVEPTAEQVMSAGTNGARPRLNDRAVLGLRLLRKAIAEFGEAAPGALDLPYGVRVARYEVWRDLLLKEMFAPDDDPASTKVRQAISDTGMRLMRAGIVGKNNPYLWIIREPSA